MAEGPKDSHEVVLYPLSPSSELITLLLRFLRAGGRKEVEGSVFGDKSLLLFFFNGLALF